MTMETKVWSEEIGDGDTKAYRDLSLSLEKDGGIRFDDVVSGPVYEAMYGDWDIEKIYQVEPGYVPALCFLLLRDILAEGPDGLERIRTLAAQNGLSIKSTTY